MKQAMWKVCTVIAAMLIIVGCGGTASDDTASGNDGKVAKGDCPDCSETGPGAMIQAGISDRFYAVGDNWMVAYQYKLNSTMNKNTVLNVPEMDLALDDSVQAARDTSEVFLYQYAVTDLTKGIFETSTGEKVQREVANIEVIPSNPVNAMSNPGDANEQSLWSAQAIGRFEHKLHFELNDLLDPVSETIFNRQYPNGRRIELDTKSRLNTGSSMIPHTVPRALVTPSYMNGTEIELSPQMEAIADKYVPNWRNRVYHRYTFTQASTVVSTDTDGTLSVKMDVELIGEPEGYRDIVYWAPGELWPFYVRTDQGEGILIRYNKAL